MIKYRFYACTNKGCINCDKEVIVFPTVGTYDYLISFPSMICCECGMEPEILEMVKRDSS